MRIWIFSFWHEDSVSYRSLHDGLIERRREMRAGGDQCRPVGGKPEEAAAAFQMERSACDGDMGSVQTHQLMWTTLCCVELSSQNLWYLWTPRHPVDMIHRRRRVPVWLVGLCKIGFMQLYIYSFLFIFYLVR